MRHLPLSRARWLSLLVLGLCLLTSRALADEDEWPTVNAFGQTKMCSLSLHVDDKGTAQVQFSLMTPKPTGLKPKQVENAVASAIVRSLSNVRANEAKQPGITMIGLTGTAVEAFRSEGGRFHGELDLSELADLLRPLGVPSISVSITEPYRPGLLSSRAGPQTFTVPTADPEPISFVLSSRRGEWLLRIAIMVGLLAGPLLLVLYQRRIALRAADHALAWYRFWRWVHWLTLGSLFVWLTAVPAFQLDSLFQQSASAGIGRFVTMQVLVTLIPAWLVAVAIRVLAEDVFIRLSKAPHPPGTIFGRTAKWILTVLLPLLLALIGVLSIVEGGPRAGIFWLLGALAVRIVSVRLTRHGPDLTPYAVTQGDLYDRIADLARLAGVKLQQLAVVPTGEMPQANAFAALGGNVMMTDHLLRSLSRREVDAVAAHELAHLKYGHPKWLLVMLLGFMAVPALAKPALPYWWQESWMQHLPLGLTLAMIAYFFVMRRFEFQVDSYAAWLTGDAEAMVTSLIKIHKLSLLPMQWGKWEEGMLTHPSTSRRLEAIARANGITRKRLQEIVDAPDGESDKYVVPSKDPGEDVIFSAEFRQKSVFRITWAMVWTVLLVPALVALATWWSGAEGVTRWVALGCGVPVTFAALLVIGNYLPVSGYAYVRRRLEEKLRTHGLWSPSPLRQVQEAMSEEGEASNPEPAITTTPTPPSAEPNIEPIDPVALGGTFVSFAPDATSRIYEGYTNWDFGYLFLLGNLLIYVGERARFALRRDQIVNVRVAPGMPRWTPNVVLFIEWRDAERATAGTFNLRAGQVRSMLDQRRAVFALHQTVQHWREQPDVAGEIPPSFAELSSPAIPEVASIAMRDAIQPIGMVFQYGFVFLLGLGLSALLGLPFSLADGGYAWYVPLTAMAVGFMDSLPLLYHRYPSVAPEAGRND